MSEYRKLEPAEIAAAADELRDLAYHHAVVELARRIYGPSVHKVTVELDGQYDDEGGTDWYINYLSAYDVDGNCLPWDVDVPVYVRYWGDDKTPRSFRQYLTDNLGPAEIDELPKREDYDSDVEFFNDFTEAHYDSWSEFRHEVLHSVDVTNLTMDTFYVDQPPALTHGDLYVKVA